MESFDANIVTGSIDLLCSNNSPSYRMTFKNGRKHEIFFKLANFCFKYLKT